ncbi:MAG: flagellar biosynthesis protein FlhF [Steroidobacterales bacterium]
MKIKRYTASSMRLALAQVRADQGTEAVILSSRRIQEGIEVVAAVDYDETLIAPAAPAPAPTAAPSPTMSAPARAAAPLAADPVLAGMKSELQSLRYLLESELASLSWNDKRMRDPLQVRVLEDLVALDIAPDVARALAALAPKRTSVPDLANFSLALLARHLPVARDVTCTEGGVVAIVGPTGVGKTTTIAKLAARWALRHRSEDLAIVSTDGYRIGAREQLQTYARILGAPLYAADSGRELAQMLERLRSKKLVLIDTAGVGPRDARLAEQLATLRQGAPRAHVFLALPAQGEAHALQEITTAFASLAPKACILTKVDEAASFGAAMSTALRHRLPIAYLCNGQRVPEDVHSAYQRRVWLVRAARKFKERRGPIRDEGYLARQFGRQELAHA